jgi:nicotinic acetylcholine receptor
MNNKNFFINQVRDDWKYVALVIDRLQLYIFFSVTLIGTILILLRAPHIFEFVDQQEILRRIRLNNTFT